MLTVSSKSGAKRSLKGQTLLRCYYVDAANDSKKRRCDASNNDSRKLYSQSCVPVTSIPVLRQVLNKNNSSPRYWMSVVSKNHMVKGVASGIAQVCHGKAAPLKRMKAGDWLINYSSVISMEKKEKLQQFTAAGVVKTGDVYQFDMGGGFIPFRVDVDYVPCKDVSIHPFIPALSFIKNPKKWGIHFRYGHFEITKEDFEMIMKELAA